jgi:hypothetical protein
MRKNCASDHRSVEKARRGSANREASGIIAYSAAAMLSSSNRETFWSLHPTTIFGLKKYERNKKYKMEKEDN